MSVHSAPVEVFYSYAHKDEALRSELEKHLSLLQRLELISSWHDRRIVPGTDWAKAIDDHLENASLILLLVSADFLASDYCYGIEMERALQRHRANEARVIPILVRPVDWRGAPFDHLEVLPTDARPITNWPNQDEAFADIATGIRRAIEGLSVLPVSARGTALPTIWNVPYRQNEFFTGRADVLTHLHTELTTKESPLPQAINGLSGIGKTQIAIEYAYRNRSKYQAVFWVKADTYQDLVSDFVTVAGELNLPEKNDRDKDHIIDAVRRWLQHNQNWLLILDNVTDEDLERMCNLCPQGSGRHILLTTRTEILDGHANSIKIKKMDLEEGVPLILRRVGLIDEATQSDRANAQAIVTVMDGLPLALEQAAAYIEKNNISLSRYLELYHRDPKKLLPTLSLSFQELERKSPAAADLLRLCAFLDPDAIPVDQIIVKGAPDLGPELQSVATDPIKLNKAIEELRKFSLVSYTTKETQELTIHRLVQDAIKDSMNKDIQHLWLVHTIRALNRAFPTVEYKEWSRCEQCLPHVLACLPLIKQEEIIGIEVTQLLNRAGSYLRERAQYVQATELIKQALDSRKDMLKLEEADEATSLHNMALLYFSQGRYVQSEPYYLGALSIRKKSLGLKHPDMATSLNDLAGLYYCQGLYAQAEKRCQQGFEIREKILGLEHADTASSLNDLGCISYRQGRYDQAEKFFRQSWSIREKLLGHEDPDTAASINNLARLYYSHGKYGEAQRLYQEALDIRQKVLGPNHPDTANSLNDLSQLYYRLARYDQAEPLYQQACNAWEKVLGPEPKHPDLATVYNNRAKLYYRQGDYTQARERYLKALNIRQQTLSGRQRSIVIVLCDPPGTISLPEHPDIAATLNDLGRLYYSQGIYSEAEKLYQHALAMREKLLDPEHSDVADTLDNLGSLHLQKANYTQAEKFYKKALIIRQKSLGDQHPDVAETLNSLGRLYYKLGQYDKAADHYQRAWVIREQVLGLEHPDSATTLTYWAILYSKQGKYERAEQLYEQARTAWEKLLEKKPLGSGLSPDMAAVLHNLAWLYYSWGKYPQAEPLYLQARAIREQVLGAEHPDVAETFNGLARLYYSQEDYIRAEPLYRQALEIRAHTLGSEHPDTATSIDNLGRLYYSQGDYKQAEPFYRQGLEIRAHTLGPEHPDTAASLNNLGRLYYRQAEFTKAEELCKQALEIREKALGIVHPDTTISLTDLAWVYTYLGNYEQAEKLYKQSLEIREKVLRPEHPYVADSLNDLAKFYAEVGNYTQAEPLYQRALALRKQVLGAESPKVAETLNDQANLLSKQRIYEQAEPLYQDALKIREKVLDPKHPYIADNLNDLALLYCNQGKYAKALPLYKRALEICEQRLRADHPYTRKIRENYMDLVRKLGVGSMQS